MGILTPNLCKYPDRVECGASHMGGWWNGGDGSIFIDGSCGCSSIGNEDDDWGDIIILNDDDDGCCCCSGGG